MTESGTTPISDEAVEAFNDEWIAVTSVALDSDGTRALWDDTVRAALAAARPLLVSAEAERLQAELDRIANIPIIAYTLDLEAQIERRRLDLGAIQDLTRADRPYDWRLEQIQQIAREGLSR